ncbi:MAG: RHS repeat-associated core domain-containing protein, partial [Candidatus Eisenbacteria bacterium]|nr:RHS repeat-associated core domain-containing protein [Candidatus Eisenbacteria bacterium]
ALTGASGAVVARYQYNPYGKLLASSGALAAANNIRFSSKYTDTETGLLYYGYRYYSPGLGRFTSRDPVGEKGFYVSCGSWLKDDSPSDIGHTHCGGIGDRECGCKAVAAEHQSQAFEARSIEEWKARKSLEALLHNPAIKPLYLFVHNSPASRIDYLGLDSPGCDWVPGGLETPCVLQCCAQHDKCFKDHGCTASSWVNPCASKKCKQCNSDAKSCVTGCGTSKKDDPNKPNYYCGKCGVFFDDPKSPHMQHSTN